MCFACFHLVWVCSLVSFSLPKHCGLLDWFNWMVSGCQHAWMRCPEMDQHHKRIGSIQDFQDWLWHRPGWSPYWRWMNEWCLPRTSHVPQWWQRFKASFIATFMMTGYWILRDVTYGTRLGWGFCVFQELHRTFTEEKRKASERRGVVGTRWTSGFDKNCREL